MIFLFKKDFKKNLNQLPKNLQMKFYERLEVFENNRFNPILNNHSLHGRYTGFESINISGDYRAIFEIIDRETVEFITIGKHSNLYK